MPQLSVTSILFALALFASDVRADGLAREVDFDINPQPLESAVIKFSKQAEIQILAASMELDGVKSSGVKGRHRVDAALQEALDKRRKKIG